MNPMTKQPQAKPFQREVRSYVKRSRMTLSQRVALTKFWSLYGVDLTDNKLDLSHIFPRKAPTVLEIGFGMGTSLLQLAQTHPECNFLGIEVHQPGMGALLLAIHESGLDNLRLIRADAMQVLNEYLDDNCLSTVLLFFPDPWPKRRHHKRRMVQPLFLDLVYSKLQENGYLHIATDIEDYANHILQAVNQHGRFMMDVGETCYPFKRPNTKFEQRGIKLGYQICEFLLLKEKGIGRS
jgi:tRNA (guanine-N7-)-methyltransferase